MSRKRKLKKKRIRYATRDELKQLYAECGEGLSERELGRPLVPLRAVATAEQVFQVRRTAADDRRAEKRIERHVEGFTKKLLSGQVELKPITVFPIGGWRVVVDGHCRLAAYRRARRKVIPVEVLRGSFENALARASKGNSEDKLPMTKADKLENAWQLVLHDEKHDCWSKSETSKMSGVSERTIATMREVLRETKGNEDLRLSTWLHARQGKWKGEYENVSGEEWSDVQREKDVDLLLKTFGKRNNRYPLELMEAFAEAYPRSVQMWLEQNGIMGGGDDSDDGIESAVF